VRSSALSFLGPCEGEGRAGRGLPGEGLARGEAWQGRPATAFEAWRATKLAGARGSSMRCQEGAVLGETIGAGLVSVWDAAMRPAM